MRAWAATAAALIAFQAQAADVLVGAYHYPWYGPDFHGGAYLRDRLVPPQAPVLGEYDDRSPEVIAQHLAWARQAGIGFWAVSWWGPDSREDRTLHEQMLTHPDLRDFRFAIHYETEGLTRNFTNLTDVPRDIDHLAEHFLRHPNCLRIGGRPVIIVYLTRAAAANGTLEPLVTAMRERAWTHGLELYLIGDHAFGPPPVEASEIACLDAITNYDVYARVLRGTRTHAGEEGVAEYLAEQTAWRDLAHRHGVAFVPGVAPGFNDRAVRAGHPPLARRLTPDDEEGSLFRGLLRGALRLTDAETDHMLLVTSWNEWHEDTQIEPVAPRPPTSRDDTPTGEELTGGVRYDGYGTLYLELLREETHADH